jgi:hypothetical protein
MFAEPVAEFAVFVLEAGKLERVSDGQKELVGGQRFLEEVESAKARGFDGHFDVGLARHEDDRGLDAGAFELLEEFKAVLAGHDDIGEDEVEGLIADELDRTRSVVANGGFVAGETEGPGEGGQGVGFVVDQKKMGFAWHRILSVQNQFPGAANPRRGQTA